MTAQTERKVSIGFSQATSGYEIIVSYGALDHVGEWARTCLGTSAKKLLVVSNTNVLSLYGDAVVDRLRTNGADVALWLMGDGEEHKNLATVENALDAFAENGISRTDAVIALGGGVVGDMTGFAASIYLRGIKFLQVPTTLLSMIDSSVGGKTGVNSRAGKNRIGTFHQPSGVLIDPAVLVTLDPREITAGYCEIIKQSVLAGGNLFDRTTAILTQFPVANMPEHFNDNHFQSAIAELIEAQVSFKASVVKADERESTERTDGLSRKILNFGHTLAHALESATNYRYFKHGEAVGYGILYAAELSKMLDLVDEKVVNLLYDVVHRAGKLPDMHHINPREVLNAFRYDKKVVDGSLQLILIRDIGQPVIVDAAEIPQTNFEIALEKLIERS